MQETIKGNAKLIDSLSELATEANAIQHSADSFGNAYHWFRLNEPDLLTDAAKLLHQANARLAMAVAYNRHQNVQKLQAVCYEFVLDGIVYNITCELSPEHPSVPSITPIFANADWHEREMIELYGIKVTGHPNPRRLFLDEKLDQGLLGEIVPLSIMMNGASSTDLWERILADKGGKQA